MYARESAKQGEQVRHQVSCIHLEQRENIALQNTFLFSLEYCFRRPSSLLLGKVKVIARKIYVLHQGRIEFVGFIFI